jgi:lysozyme
MKSEVPYRVRGIDISHHNVVTDWTAVRASGIVFAFIRASHGAKPDRKFAEHWQGARAAGLIVGAYHYYEPRVDYVEQAGALLDMLAGIDAEGMLPPVLDVEEGAPQAQDLLSWLGMIERCLGLCPWIYTMPSWWSVIERMCQAEFARHPLWIAHWTEAEHPLVPAPWADWIVWQHSNKGKVSGINGDVDLNTYNGSEDDLGWMAAGCE